MSTPSYKNPPSLEKDKDYQQFKNEVKMWELVTDLDKKKRGLALALSLQDKPREVALQMDPAKLNADDGVQVLIAELDKVFEKDKLNQVYSAYQGFDKFKRDGSLNMSDYIVEFEQRYNKAKKYEMTLSDNMLALKLLDNAGLQQSDRQLALTACSDVKFDTMKAALNRIFGTQLPLLDSASAVVIKEESAFLTERHWEKGKQKRPPPRFKDSNSNTTKGSQPKLNPVIGGKISRCRICDSKYHWVRFCPDKYHEVKLTEDQEDEPETVNITLFLSSTNNLSPQSVFVAEAFNTAVIDTACTKTVCGSNWLHQYVDSLDEKSQKKITCSESKTPFKFGDGKTVYSNQLVKFPAKIGTNNCSIEAEVVDCELPLLLSKESLKRAKTILDLNSDKVSMFGEQIDVNFTSSGHYCVNISNSNGHRQLGKDIEQVLLINSEMSKEEKRDILLKLHKQFGHKAPEKLISLLKSAGDIDAEVPSIVKDICSNCAICHKLKRPKAKPIVAFAHASDFNQIVAMDLHEIDHNFYYLHIIDLFSRLSAAAIIRKKESKVIVDKFMQIWVGIYGAPEVGVYTDNGGEFNSQVFRDMAENLNMSVKTTAGYSPWSNGIVERHNATLTETLMKMKEDTDLSWETAISWAVNAKNSLLNVHGFSPYQIVYGRNPNLPSVIVNKPPALEGETMCHFMGKHLTGLYSGRKAFIASESSEKIRRALRKQIRPSGEKFSNGDKVYFLRDNKWKGPGWVIGQDNVVVFIRYGGTLVRVHESRIKRYLEESQESRKTVPNSEPMIQVDPVKDKPDVHVSHGKDDASGDLTPDYKVQNSDDSDTEESAADHDTEDNAVEHEYESDYNPSEDRHLLQNTLNQSSNALTNQEIVAPNFQTRVENIEGSKGLRGTDTLKLKENDVITFQVMGEANRREATILSRAGKASTNKRNWYNIEYLKPENMKGDKLSIDLNTVQDLHCIQPENEGEIEEVFINKVDFKEAEKVELDNWKNHNVYNEMDDMGQQCISMRWVKTLKEDEEEIKKKARLVVRGFEEDCLEDLKKNSPTCDKSSLRIILSVMKRKRWELNSIDIKTAFLQGEKIQREVFVRPPKEANVPGKIWKLNKCVYGLADASLMWYEKVKTTLIKCGAKVSRVDPAVFYWHGSNGLYGILAVHVDDFLWAGTAKFKETVIVKLRKLFNVGKEACKSFKYIGLELSQDEERIILSQKNYTAMLKTFAIDRNREKTSPLSAQERSILRSKVGQLLWLSKQTRPDIAYDVTTVASRLSVSTVDDMKRVNKIIRKVQSEEVNLNFYDLGGHFELLLFSDASFGNLADGGSQGGYVIFLKGRNGKINPVTWQSKKIRRVVRSTLASETLALADGVDCVISNAMLLNELLFNNYKANNIPIKCYVDNNDLHQAIYSEKHVIERRLRIELNSLKELIQSGEISDINWVNTDKQIANVLTKNGASGQVILDTFERGMIDFLD